MSAKINNQFKILMVIYINKQWEVFQNTQLDLKILFKKTKPLQKIQKQHKNKTIKMLTFVRPQDKNHTAIEIYEFRELFEIKIH